MNAAGNGTPPPDCRADVPPVRSDHESLRAAAAAGFRPTGRRHVLTVLQWVLVAIGLGAAGVTLLSLSRSPRWPVRVWDFPRMQIAAVAATAGIAYAACFSADRLAEWAFLAVMALATGWQIRWIFPYTRLARAQVQRSRVTPAERPRFKLLISNVLMENTQHDRLIEVIRACDPDIVLAVEIDRKWERALEPLCEAYPHVVRQAQENYYGLILFSRLPLVDPKVTFLIQDDIPSVHTGVRLPNGDLFFLHGLHPRPPEPIRDQDATPRDAELVVVGRTIGEDSDRPTVVAGDLNDVAWSPSSALFLRLSGLLDPRIGRGFYNSFNAKNPLFRYPLDHVFHSNHFRLVDLRRLPKVGSDHFPMFIELSYEPEARATQPETEAQPGDQEEADERLEEQAEAAATGDDRPGRGESDKG